MYHAKEYIYLAVGKLEFFDFKFKILTRSLGESSLRNDQFDQHQNILTTNTIFTKRLQLYKAIVNQCQNAFKFLR